MAAGEPRTVLEDHAHALWLRFKDVEYQGTRWCRRVHVEDGALVMEVTSLVGSELAIVPKTWRGLDVVRRKVAKADGNV